MPRPKTPWKRIYHAVDVLSASQVEALSQKFDLSQSQVTELQKALIGAIYAFVIDSGRGAAEAAEKKGKPAFDAALRSLDDACRTTDNALQTLRKLTIHSRSAEDNFSDNYPNLIKSLEIARAMTGRALANLLKAGEHDLRLSLQGFVDGRNTTDLRREWVCYLLIKYWEGLGRKDKYSTTEVSKKTGDDEAAGDMTPNAQGTVPTQRTGPLVEFILDVSGFLTDPSSPLPRETIRNEIKGYFKRKRKAEEDALAQVAKPEDLQ